MCWSVERVLTLTGSVVQLLYTESPTNPTMSVVDLEALAAFTNTVPNLVTAVDATFASPYLMEPIKLGMDISIHSWLVRVVRRREPSIVIVWVVYAVLSTWQGMRTWWVAVSPTPHLN